jgi:ankyrin repeat protein
LAASNGHLEVVQWLYDHGADIRADNDYAVRWAAAMGHLEVVQWLHEHGADIHAVRRSTDNAHSEVFQWI